MSLILEALRRSEAQRRRGQAPDLHTPMPAPVVRRRGRGIAPVLLALALGTAIGLGWTLLPRADTPLPVAPVAPIAPALPPPPMAAPPAPTPPPSAAALARELDVPPAPPAVAPPPSGEARPVEAVPPADGAPPVGPTTTATTTIATANGAADDVASLPAGLRETLPPLRLSMHVYDEDPARRFAIVDGQRVREGEALAPGLRVVAIERDGLRLDWQGRALDLRR